MRNIKTSTIDQESKQADFPQRFVHLLVEQTELLNNKQTDKQTNKQTNKNILFSAIRCCVHVSLYF